MQLRLASTEIVFQWQNHETGGESRHRRAINPTFFLPVKIAERKRAADRQSEADIHATRSRSETTIRQGEDMAAPSRLLAESDRSTEIHLCLDREKRTRDRS